MINLKNKVIFLMCCISSLVTMSLFSCGNRDCITEFKVKAGSKIIKKQIDKCSGGAVVKEQEFETDSLGRLVAAGFACDFDKAGRLMKKGYYIDGKLFGPQYDFFENGRINSVIYYTQNVEKWLTIKFNEKGELIDVVGKLFRLTLDKNSPYLDSIPVDHPLLLIIEVAKLEGMTTTLNMKIANPTNSLLDTTVVNYIPFFNSFVTGLKQNFTKKGSYLFSGSLTLSDSVSKKEIYTDTFSKAIVVY